MSLKKTILVIDDEIDLQQLVKIALKSKGYNVETANNGQECLAGIEKFAPNLVLLDIEMPVLNGMEVLQKIRQAPKPPAVMMITGNEDVAIARKCMELGACDYLVKPFNFEYLDISVWAKILTATPTGKAA